MSRVVVQLARWAIVVTGSRNWTDRLVIRDALQRYPFGTVVLHGDAGGADTIAHSVAQDLGQVPTSHPYFNECGRAGGAVRNGLLADLLSTYRQYGYQTAIEAFALMGHENKGTLNMCNRGTSKGFKPNITWGSLK